MRNTLFIGLGAAAILCGTGAEAATCSASFEGQDNLCAVTQAVNFSQTVDAGGTNNSTLLLDRGVISVSKFDASLGTRVGAEVVVDGSYDLSFAGDPGTLEIAFDVAPAFGSATFERLPPTFQVVVPDTAEGTFSGTLRYSGGDAVSGFQSPVAPTILIDVSALGIFSSPSTVSAAGEYSGSIELTYFYQGDMAPIPLPASGLILLAGVGLLGFWKAKGRRLAR